MSQTKVQLIAPIGVVTATTLETTGVLTATTFVGDIAGTVTGITSTTDNLNLGIITATSFAGDFTGIGSGLTGTPNVVAGVVTATKFVGNTPGTVSGIADGTNINAGIITATSFVGNITGNAAGLSTTTGHANLGIVTATSFHGSGANLSGVSAGPVAQQAVTADGASTTIDLSSGNVIYMTQSANTTVAFANTEGNTDVVYLIRIKDDNTTARTITWPSGMVWNGGTEPTLLAKSGGAAIKGQTFKLTTRDNGATWYGGEVVNYDAPEPFTLWAWGYNTQGALAQNNTTALSSPTQIPGTTWTKVSSGREGRSAGALKTDNTLWMLGGDNRAGQLGQNNKTYYSSPVQIPGTTWNYISGGGNNLQHYAGLKTDGTLWMWGDNEQGMLGMNNDTSYSSPVQLPGTTWSQTISSNYSSFAIKTNGTLWAWGYNYYGDLGINLSGHPGKRSSPIQIPGTTWAAVEGLMSSAAMATRTDGTLWAWGWNTQGQLGQNQAPGTVGGYSSPVQIPGTTWSTDVLKLGGGNGHAAAIKTDGTLWIWGNNTVGQLGQNSYIKYSSPVQVPGTTWRTVSFGNRSVFATKTDGTLWSWGYNAYGALGQNAPDNANYSSPIQIPGTWGTSVEGVGYAAFGLKSI